MAVAASAPVSYWQSVPRFDSLVSSLPTTRIPSAAVGPAFAAAAASYSVPAVYARASFWCFVSSWPAADVPAAAASDDDSGGECAACLTPRILVSPAPFAVAPSAAGDGYDGAACAPV